MTFCFIYTEQKQLNIFKGYKTEFPYMQTIYNYQINHLSSETFVMMMKAFKILSPSYMNTLFIYLFLYEYFINSSP